MSSQIKIILAASVQATPLARVSNWPSPRSRTMLGIQAEIPTSFRALSAVLLEVPSDHSRSATRDTDGPLDRAFAQFVQAVLLCRQETGDAQAVREFEAYVSLEPDARAQWLEGLRARQALPAFGVIVPVDPRTDRSDRNSRAVRSALHPSVLIPSQSKFVVIGADYCGSSKPFERRSRDAAQPLESQHG